MRITLGVVVTLSGAVMLTQAQEATTGNSNASAQISSGTRSRSPPVNKMIDFGSFVGLTRDLEQVRQSRRIPIETFNEMSCDADTMILDTRSKWAYDVVHVVGAVHLNFSDFTAEKLRQVVPSKTTRILIYCNNNFGQPVVTGFDSTNAGRPASATARRLISESTGPRDRQVKNSRSVIEGTTNKFPSLALNIPTFVNLHGYGYENVYELADLLDLDDPRLKLAGTGVAKRQ